MHQYPSLKTILVLLALILAASACNRPDKAARPSDPKTESLKLPDGFHAEHLYSPGEHDQGSWVAMTFDNKGRMIACDQYGYLYRLTIPPIGADTTTSKLVVEKLDVKVKGDTSSKMSIGFAHGLLYAFNSLYVMVNDEGDTSLTRRSGLYRVQDTDNDDQYDKITLLKRLEGDGEHGPHTAVLSPDGQSLYIVAGNFTSIPKMDVYRSVAGREMDNILPLIRDPNGHDNTVNTHGGWIARTDSAGTKWELISSGFRNPFDICFNDAGDLFAYDSDMEWDFGLPWYRPTRICHVTSGGEFGWRPGTEKWSPANADGLPPVINVGQGSPTSFFNGQNARFPEKYRKALFAFDWSFGIIYAIHLEPRGASYNAKGEEFVSGSPLPLTDGVIGPDGALYFLTGGRRIESDFYRVYYDDNQGNSEKLAAPALNEEQQIRRKLEAYHGLPQTGALDFAWPYLNHQDRFIRYAARIAVEDQPVAQWKDRALNEKDPVILTQAIIGLARTGTPGMGGPALKALMTVDQTKLSEQQQQDLVRAFELVMVRLGMPPADLKAQVATYLAPMYPAKTNELNRQLSKVLLAIGAPGAVEKTMALLESAKDDNTDQNTITQSSDLILRNPQYGTDIATTLSNVPPAQQTFYATALSQAKTGWTPELQEKYFQWFGGAFKYKGGHSFPGFIENARKSALAKVPKGSLARLDSISAEAANVDKNAAAVEQPKGPGRDWTVEEAVAMADSGIDKRDIDHGKSMFAASLCIACHTMNGEGGVSGPDLTQLGTRFSYKDMLESIIEPSKAISDQYGATVFYLKEGGSVLGRMISQDNDKYVISQNPFAPSVTREIPKKDVVRTRVSEISPMLPGMINRLNPEELKDLLYYLKTGGKK